MNGFNANVYRYYIFKSGEIRFSFPFSLSLFLQFDAFTESHLIRDPDRSLGDRTFRNDILEIDIHSES